MNTSILPDWKQFYFDLYNNAHAAPDKFETLPNPPGVYNGKAHIVIRLFEDGTFCKAGIAGGTGDAGSYMESGNPLMIPMPSTEAAISSSSLHAVPRALFDKISNIASDYQNRGGLANSAYSKETKDSDIESEGYIELLSGFHKWLASTQRTRLERRVGAVLAYIQNGSLIADLSDENNRILWTDKNGNLLYQWNEDSETPPVFKHSRRVSATRASVMQKIKSLDAENRSKAIYDQGSLIAAFAVSSDGTSPEELWKDFELLEAWSSYYCMRRVEKMNMEEKDNPCRPENIDSITGEHMPLMKIFPNKICGYADAGKIISSSDVNGLTYKGRFNNSNEILSMGYESASKIFSALSWVIQDRKQYISVGSRYYVIASRNGGKVPDITDSTDCLYSSGLNLDMFDHPIDTASDEAAGLNTEEGKSGECYANDCGQATAFAVKKLVSGYSVRTDASSDVLVIGIDSFTKNQGHKFVFYEKMLSESSFLDHILMFHKRYGWLHTNEEHEWFGIPNINTLVEMALLGHSQSDTQKTLIFHSIINSMLNGSGMPQEIVQTVINHAIRYIGIGKDSETVESLIETACGLWTGHNVKTTDIQNLGKSVLDVDRDNKSPSYNIGRLLAAYDSMERVLHKTKHIEFFTDTCALRSFSKFVNTPGKAMREIKYYIEPHISWIKEQLLTLKPLLLKEHEAALEEISRNLSGVCYKNSLAGGEVLVGFWCQRRAFDSLNIKKKARVKPLNIKNGGIL